MGITSNAMISRVAAPGVALRPALRACAVRAQSTAAPASSVTDRILNADQSLSNVHLYHQSGMALAIATPIALVYPNLPCDVILSTVFPLMWAYMLWSRITYHLHSRVLDGTFLPQVQ